MRRRDVLRAGAATLLPLAAGRSTATPGTPTGSGTATDAEPDVDALGSLPLPGAKELVVDDGVAYVAVTDGFATVDLSDPADPALLAERRDLLADHPDGPMARILDGKVGGDRYAVAGPGRPMTDVPRAALVYDVSDPADPERVLTHDTGVYVHNLDTDGETLYLCLNDGERNPLVCVDVETGEPVGRWSVLDADDRWAEVHHGLREMHDVQVVEDRAFCACWEAGTWVLDVSDPAEPTPVVQLRGRDPETLAAIEDGSRRREARFSLPGNDHYADPRSGTDDPLLALNEEAWATEAGATRSALGGVELWDREARERRARIEAPPTPDPTFGGVWTTSHNFEYDGDRLYTAWYRGGVKVHDVSDPADPVELAHWRDAATTDFWTAQAGDGHVVASSWRNFAAATPEDAAAVFTFPDVGSGTATPTPTDDGTATEGSEGAGDGLGALAGAAGLGLAGLYRRLRD